MKLFSLSICVVVLLCAAAYAQQQTQQTATTDKGQKVLLSPDGTWRYAESPSGSSLKVEAGVIYKTGGPEPAARVTFYLLDTFPLDELDQLPPAKSVTAEFIATCGESPASASEVVGRHVLYKFQTGFDGKGELTGIKPGRYWLFGGAKTRAGCVLWAQPLDLTKDQSVTLDQHNAVSAR